MLFFCYYFYFYLILSGAPVSAHLYSSKRRAKTPESQYFFITDILSPRRCRFANVSKQYTIPLHGKWKNNKNRSHTESRTQKGETPG